MFPSLGRFHLTPSTTEGKQLIQKLVVILFSFFLLFLFKNSFSRNAKNKSKMNGLGLTLLIKSCICMRETIEISGSKYTIIERIAIGKKTFFDELVQSDLILTLLFSF